LIKPFIEVPPRSRGALDRRTVIANRHRHRHRHVGVSCDKVIIGRIAAKGRGAHGSRVGAQIY
jgi:hypothetical protein